MSDLYKKASLVMLPQAVDTSKVYSIKPENRDGDFTFTRSTYATRVNADGNIEKETQNLLLQSNDFDTTWTTSSASVTSGQSGYDGSSDAWLISATAQYGRIVQSVSVSGVNTISVYAKEGTTDAIFIRANGGTNPRAFFNLDDGTLGSIAGNYIDRSIEDVGSGWYRCSMSFNESVTEIRIYPAENGNVFPTSGNIYIQDAQLEQGLVARDYIETTTAAVEGGITDNVPRLDYTDSSCPSLLLEPQRTNSIIHSEYFGGWSTAGGTITRTYNAATSPEGVDNATRVVSSSTGVRMRGGNVSVTSGEKWTYSIFAKENTTDSFRMRHEISANFAITFDLGDESFTGSGDWYDDAAIEDYGDGWYRCIVYLTADSTENRSFEVDFQNNDDLYFYGAQVEAGSYATSYIPTYGSAVTRNADYCSITNMENDITSSATEATLFLEFTRSGTGHNIDALRLHATGNANGRAFLYNTSMGFAADWNTGNHHTFSLDAVNKSIWRLNSLSSGNLFLNGSKALNDDTGTAWANIGKLEFNGAGGTLRVHTAYLIKEALSDDECIDLTTL